MERYDKYKDSGIAWLGEIPEHWGVSKAKWMFVKNKRERRPEDEVITCFRDGQVTLRKNRRLTGFTESEKYDGYQGVRKGDLVIHQMDAFAGSIGVSDSDGMATSVLHCCTPIGNENVYYYAYLLRHMAKSGYIQSLYKGIRERSSDFSFPIFRDQLLAVPPTDEQEKIVEYIESKTLIIDSYVRERERELRLLNELKQAEIAQAVTRGLNPNVPMKECQTPMLGKIPVHWEERKMKYCFSERSEKNHPDEPILCATQSQGVIPQSMYANRVVVVNKGFDGLKLVKVGDFVISLRSFEGGIEYAYYQGIISAAYTILTPIDPSQSEYFKLLFKSYPFIQLLQTCVTGIREGQNINYSLLGRKYIPIPPSSEQKEIVTYINDKFAKVNSLITELEEEIAYLKEYKQRLIADAVTGKMKVC